LFTPRTSWIKLKTLSSNSKRKTIPRLRRCWVLLIHLERCGLSWQRRRWSELTPPTQQITTVIFLFYNAPTRPAGVFDDFLAIQSAQGNVSTISYSDYVLNANSVTPPGSRLVIHRPRDGNETGLTYLTLSLYYKGVPVTQYSPAVFDAFVNHTRVSSVLRAFADVSPVI